MRSKYVKLTSDTVNPIAPDGAGIVYPYVANKHWNSSYRIIARLKSEVDPQRLQEAVDKMQKAYPYFFSHIVKAGREFRLAQSDKRLLVAPDDGVICRAFDLKNDLPLIRVLYTDSTVALEVFHSISDGHGSLEFFKNLLIKYFNVGSSPAAEKTAAQSCGADGRLSNTEDIFASLYENGGKNVSRLMLSSVHVGKGMTELPVSAAHINLKTDELLAAVKGKDVSVTVFLCALLMTAISENEQVSGKKIRISVPVDIRKFFNKSTSRNASLYIMPEIKSERIIGFTALLKNIKEQFAASLTKENMQNMVYTNVKSADMTLFKLMPVFLKKAVLNFGYRFLGENQFSAALTNLGVLTLPAALDEQVENVSFVLGKTKIDPLNLTVLTYGGVTQIVVSATIDSSGYVSKLTELLAENNLSVIE